MKNKPLIIVCNERVSKNKDNEFFSINADLQILPDGLGKYFDVSCIFRKNNNEGNHKFNLKKIFIASNIFIFIKNLIKTFDLNEAKYLIITITPFSFISFLILFFFKKKVFVYLMSSGHDEWKNILGSWSVRIYDFMFKIVTQNSKVIVCHKRLYNEDKSFLIKPARLNEQWFKNHKNPDLSKVKYLYVGRYNPEKGIENFIKLFNSLKVEAELSLAGEGKKINITTKKKINQFGYISDENSLINLYDEHNILILPSFTDAHPYVVDESLSRLRPVIIFKEIEYIKENKAGIFVIERNSIQLEEITNLIIKNYNKIQEDMKKNILPSKDKMLKDLKEIIDIN